MNESLESAAKLHERVPPNWYVQSVKINKGQAYWHNTRFRTVAKLIDPVEGKVLDIGCADGLFTQVILKKTKAQKVIGIDVLKSSVQWAKNHWKKNKKMQFKLGNAHKLDFEKDTFGAVFALEVLEHVPEPEKVLKEIKRVLKKGGYAIFLVPTDSLLFRSIWFIWTKFWRGKIWDDCHIQSFQKDSLVDVAQRVGFTVEVNKKFQFGMLQAIKVRK